MRLEEDRNSGEFSGFTGDASLYNPASFAGYNFANTGAHAPSSGVAVHRTFSHYSSFEPAGVSTSSVMASMANGGKTLQAAGAAHHDDGDHDHHVHAPNEISSAGSTYNPSAAPSAADPYYINALKSGTVWTNNGSGVTINYKFWASLPSYYSGADQEATNFQPFTAAMKSATQEILGLLQNLVNVTFVQVASDNAAQLGFAQAKLTAGAGAWAYYPGSYAKAGDVWTNNMYAASTQNVAHGMYGYQTLLHEIGHAMGLKHSFDGANKLTGAEDTSRYTVMSYTWPFYAESYMLYDIAALQNLYGANMNYATGDNTYSLLSGHAYTIWDAGGTDTMDGSALTANLTLNLNEGTFSDIGAIDNIAIAFGVTIENANGGSGNDIIYGNAADNVINGNNGNDTIYGSDGNDTLDGGAGNDTLVYNASLQSFTINIINASTVMLTHAAGTDIASNFESFVFSNATATFADLQALSSGNIDTRRVGVMNGALTYSFDSLFTSTSIVTSTQLGLKGVATNMFSLHRSSNTNMTITVLNAKAPGKQLTLTADDDGSFFTLAGTHKAMAVLFNGGAGDDSFTAASTIAGNDRIYGGGGNDLILAGNGNDIVYGDDGNDILSGEAGNDTMYGGNGNDTLNGGLGIDKMYGDAGDDILNGGDGNDTMYGGDGNDTLNGDAGNDILYGGNNNDTINGGAGNDKLYGDAGDDALNGGDGIDLLYGGDGNDTLNGGAGNDKLYGDAGDDILHGGDGNDMIYGGIGNNTLYGDAGNDTLYGDTGNDILIGGLGKDTMYGKGGSDTFGFNAIDNNVDLIKDFTLTGPEADKINITDILSGYDALSDDINNFVRVSSATKTAMTLQVNVDGAGTDWVTIATVNGSNFTGVTVNSLVASGQLIADQHL